jgi:deoxyribodipyrimidine photolyase-like uncharacterized protein
MVFISCENFIFYEYKMISQEVIASAIQEWEKRPDEIDNQLEGFVRQIMDGVSTCEEFIG